MEVPFFNFKLVILSEYADLNESGETDILSVVVQLLKVVRYEMIRKYTSIVLLNLRLTEYNILFIIITLSLYSCPNIFIHKFPIVKELSKIRMKFLQFFDNLNYPIP